MRPQLNQARFGGLHFLEIATRNLSQSQCRLFETEFIGKSYGV
jgi:hypothetical protein